MGTNYGEVTCDGLASRPEGVEILLPASCNRNRDKLRSGSFEPVGFKASPSFYLSVKPYILLERFRRADIYFPWRHKR